MKEGGNFAIAGCAVGVVAGKGVVFVEIIHPKLCVQKHAIRNLPKHLNPCSPEADVEGLRRRVAERGRAGIAIVKSQPGLVQERGLKVVRAGFVEVVTQVVADVGIFIFLGKGGDGGDEY